ncbi:MAG: hypothetical protein LBS60_08995 [Deltaproteobacteria bacterium]|jgi:hypothetical protein|nr:hypothetical protein [Deltaproteobacteria bacterium]
MDIDDFAEELESADTEDFIYEIDCQDYELSVPAFMGLVMDWQSFASYFGNVKKVVLNARIALTLPDLLKAHEDYVTTKADRKTVTVAYDLVVDKGKDKNNVIISYEPTDKDAH